MITTRIVINEHGEAVPQATYEKEYQETVGEVAIYFLCQDGFAIGAARHLEAVAYSIWQDEWSMYIRCVPGRQERILRHIKNYVPYEEGQEYDHRTILGQ